MTQRKESASRNNNRASGLVSVIIPAYNNERFLRDCIESVLRQTYDKYEIIIVNDKSTDDTLYLAKQYQLKYDFIRVIDNPQNRGQGYCRNYALSRAQGDYILFLDSDDFLEPVTLEVAVNRIEDDKSDLVVFDWKYYKTNTNSYIYNNKDAFFSKSTLLDDECLDMFQVKTHFTVNKLYSKEFLTSNNIKYGEGYIYEDTEFWVGVCLNATKVSLIHSPLYNVRISSTSSTKTNYDTDFHYRSYIKAVKTAMNLLRGRGSHEAYYHLYKYFIRKFWSYYEIRTPRQYKKAFLDEFVAAMHGASLISYNIPNKLTRWTFRAGVFQYNRPKTFHVIYILYKAKQKYKKFIKATKRKLKKCLSNRENSENIRCWEKYGQLPKNDIILFMGFNGKYTGNSRYLFEQILARRKSNVYYVTDNSMVTDAHRVTPRSNDFYKLFYSSRIVIFESWIPRYLRKAPGATWIQLWHGTPIKKMLFDSSEENITLKRTTHKKRKYQDISRWDYLITDNQNVNTIFERAFLIPKNKILSLGYPRVKYLIDNKDNTDLKHEIKQRLGIQADKKIILYLPTWRDYNYGTDDNQFDLDYLMDTSKLQQILGDEYMVITKNHSYLDNKDAHISNIDAETQELLLISDCLVTDYSSAMFDAFAIDVPVVLFVKDYEKYCSSRGVYKDIWRLLHGMICNTEQSVANMIKDYDTGSPSYRYIRDNLCYNKSQKYSACDAILNIANHGGKLIRNTMVYDKLRNIGPSTMQKLALAKDNSSFTFLGVAECTSKNRDLFEITKKSLQSLGDAWAVVPIKSDKPSDEELEKYDISTVIADETDNSSFSCNTVRISTNPENTGRSAKQLYIRNV